MVARLPGISGSLFPSQYLVDGLPLDAPTDARLIGARQRPQRQLTGWWQRVSRMCGPVTGVRALFDEAAMPLAGLLGFRARHADFDRREVRVALETADRRAVVMLVRPWAERPPGVWRDVSAAAREIGAAWGLVLALPHLSLVDARGHAARRALDFTFPDVLGTEPFQVLWTLARAEAFDESMAIDRLARCADRFADRVRHDLQDGVVDALDALVGELGSRPASAGRPDRPFLEALTIVYRVLFLLFAESRDLVPRAHPIYRDAYTVAALCREAEDPEPARGLWEALAAITRLSRAGCRTDDLIVHPFNGRLFAKAAAPSLEATRRSRARHAAADTRDEALRKTLVALATRPAGGLGRHAINYADLGVEQLGAVYERVLDLDPAHIGQSRRPATAQGHSARRKETGTFYTPQALCDFVVRRTLAPLVSGAPADAILQLKIVDPAMGSGAFLVAACRYLATAYEHALVDDGRLAPIDVDEAARADMRRLIAERCLAGVDANPVAVQLARLSLWLATLADGKPLTFLDHRLRCGNSLVGASPDDLRRMPGRRTSSALANPLPLFDDVDFERLVARVARPLRDLTIRRDDTVDAVHAKEAAWTAITGDRSPFRHWRAAADLWCARWFWPSRPEPSDAEMRAAIDAALERDTALRGDALAQVLAGAASARASHEFFHWPLEFADVFYDEHGRALDRPGFDAVIGNPPWEMLRRDGGRDDDTRGLHRFIRESGLYPSCGRGHVNLYQPFVDRALSLARPGGRMGLIVPWGLAVDEGAAALRARLLDRTSIDTVVGLDNAAGLFPIHRGLRFMVVTTRAGGATGEIRARFGVKTATELESLPERAGDVHDVAAGPIESPAWPVRLTPAALRQMGGASRRIPDLRRPADLEWLEHLTRVHPRLGDESGWHVRFGRELNATDDRESFGRIGLPVIDGKHVHPFTVDPAAAERRIERARAIRLLPDGRFDAARLAYRDVAGVGNRLSLIAAIVPAGVVTTHTLFCLKTLLPIEQQHYLCALLNSYVLNAIARMLMGGHLTTALVEDLPAPPWRATAAERRIARLSRRLSSSQAEPLLAARLQAAVARLYGLDVAAYERILEGFPLVAREERDLALARLSRRERS